MTLGGVYFELGAGGAGGGCARSHPTAMSNLASPVILPARPLLLASNGPTQEPKPSRPWIPGRGIGTKLFCSQPERPPKVGSWKTPDICGQGEWSWPRAGRRLQRVSGCSQHFQFLSCQRSPGAVSSKALCELKAVLAARLILHGGKKKKNQPGEVIAASFSHIRSPGAGAERATGRRTSLPWASAAWPSPRSSSCSSASRLLFRRLIQF